MKKILFLFNAILMANLLNAGITEYTFTSTTWASTVGSTKCDGKTDGWVCNKEAGTVGTPRYDAEQRLMYAGVGVQTAQSGAGATSVKSFTKVRKIIVNFCLNSSKGRGTIYFQIGDNTPDSLVITKPAKSGEGVYNRDSVIVIGEKTGKIKFWIVCKENAIYLNTLDIRAEEGGSNPFTQSSFQLVTNIHQLQDSDQIIFGVADGQTNMIMGYYDELVSQNNIHAIKGVYADMRTTVRENEDAIYTLWKETGENDQDTVYIFQDELRYEEAYLVATGGKTKNKLTLWTDVVSPAYGNNGFWRMTIADDGAAIIENAGTSERKYMQYNANDQLFSCYADPHSQTKVCIYRQVPAKGTDNPAIAANMVNFGNVRLSGGQADGQTILVVNANKLTEDITCSFKHGQAFQLSSYTLDRDGDKVNVSYHVTTPGKYLDTLVLSSTGVTAEVTVMVNVVAEKTIAEAVQAKDFEFIYLNPVVVTKKYDQYVFIRDATGSMLIWDGINPQTGKRYAQNVEAGHQLSNVQGHFKNYYGVPELQPTAAWTVAAQKVAADPEVVTTTDSADVCRFVRYENATINADNTLDGKNVQDMFQYGRLITEVQGTVDAIVMISHDVVELWIVNQNVPTDLLNIDDNSTFIIQNSKWIINGHLYIRKNGKNYNVVGVEF